MQLLQHLLGNGSGGHAADGFTRGGPPAAAAGLDAVFGLVGGIGVRRPKGHLHFLVIAWPLVFVAHHHGDRRAEAHPIEQATECLNAVVLFARRCDLALAGLAPVQFSLNGLDVDG